MELCSKRLGSYHLFQNKKINVFKPIIRTQKKACTFGKIMKSNRTHISCRATVGLQWKLWTHRWTNSTSSSVRNSNNVYRNQYSLKLPWPPSKRWTIWNKNWISFIGMLNPAIFCCIVVAILSSVILVYLANLSIRLPGLKTLDVVHIWRYVSNNSRFRHYVGRKVYLASTRANYYSLFTSFISAWTNWSTTS